MWTLGLVVLVIVILRVPGYFMMEVYNIPGCDLFASKVLAGRADIDEFIGEVYRYFDISVQVQDLKEEKRKRRRLVPSFVRLFRGFIRSQRRRDPEASLIT